MAKKMHAVVLEDAQATKFFDDHVDAVSSPQDPMFNQAYDPGLQVILETFETGAQVMSSLARPLTPHSLRLIC